MRYAHEDTPLPFPVRHERRCYASTWDECRRAILWCSGGCDGRVHRFGVAE